MSDVSSQHHQGGDIQTYEVAHSTRRVEFPRFYEGFDEPVTKLRDARGQDRVRDTSRKAKLTGMRTVLIPNPFKRWTSA